VFRTTDNLNPHPELPKTATKRTKRRTIFTKEMMTAMPRLLWLPGDFLQIGTESDDSITSKFRQSAVDFGVVSLMIYAEVLPLYRICLFTFSTPIVTLLFGPISSQSERRSNFALPPDVTAEIGRAHV
jgi:hypothetical protein